MEMIEQDIAILRALAEKLEPRRNDQPIINDMFEAADDWKNFGRDQLSKDDPNLSARMQQELDTLKGLRAFYGDEIDQDADYAKIMECGARLIEACSHRRIDPDGWLGIVKILRRTFAFLASDFGLESGSAPEDAFVCASDQVRVTLGVPKQYASCCRLTRVSNPSRHLDLEDLLFMGGRFVLLTLQPTQEFTTEAEVQAWFTMVADILRQYGSDVLADRPGAFERLAQASAERDRLIGEECERLYKLENPGKPVPEPGSGF